MRASQVFAPSCAKACACAVAGELSVLHCSANGAAAASAVIPALEKSQPSMSVVRSEIIITKTTGHSASLPFGVDGFAGFRLAGLRFGDFRRTGFFRVFFAEDFLAADFRFAAFFLPRFFEALAIFPSAHPNGFWISTKDRIAIVNENFQDGSYVTDPAASGFRQPASLQIIPQRQ